MAGVRLHHPTERNVRFIISEPSIPYSSPRQCTPPEFGGCGQVHLFKTHHLNVDDTGSVIVGDVLFEKAKMHFLAAGFELGNIVERPPALGIGVGQPVAGTGAWGNIPIVRGGTDG